MAMTATERSRVLRERHAEGKVVLTIVVGKDELAQIARAGYAEAASTDRKARKRPLACSWPTQPGSSCNDEITLRARLGSLPDAGDRALPRWGRHGRVFRRQPSPLPANTSGASARFFRPCR
jgi:hypothetical protein